MEKQIIGISVLAVLTYIMKSVATRKVIKKLNFGEGDYFNCTLEQREVRRNFYKTSGDRAFKFILFFLVTSLIWAFYLAPLIWKN